MKDILFTLVAFEQYTEWMNTDKQIFKRLCRLIIETAKTPYEGIGKPELLKYDLAGYWSRRITEEHRLVYRVEETFIKIVYCKYHYK